MLMLIVFVSECPLIICRVQDIPQKKHFMHLRYVFPMIHNLREILPIVVKRVMKYLFFSHQKRRSSPEYEGDSLQLKVYPSIHTCDTVKSLLVSNFQAYQSAVIHVFSEG